MGVGKTQIQSVAKDRLEINERGFIRPDIEMLGRLIQERDSIVVEKRGRRRPTLFCAKQEERGRA